jgi:outer membrane protein assembly factor BamB
MEKYKKYKFEKIIERTVLIIFILIFGISESSANWQNFGGDLQHSGYSESSPVPLELIWKYKVGSSDISSPIVDAGALYVGSDDNNLYAIDIMTGNLKWRYTANGKIFTPTAIDGNVFFPSADNFIYALDSDGNLKWKYKTGSSSASPPVIYNDILYGGCDRYICAIYVINGSLKWKYATNSLIESAPAIAQGMIYFGSNDNNIYAIDKNKNLKWQYKTGGKVSSSPSVVNGILYIGSNDNNIYALDSGTGELKWSKKTGDWIKSSAAVFGNSVYIGSDDNALYDLNIDNGDIIWTFRINGGVDLPPIVTRDIVYTGSEDGTIYALDATKGTPIEKYVVGGKIISLALSDNMLFSTSKDGYVYAFGMVSTTTTNMPATTMPATTTIIPFEIKINPIPDVVVSDKLTISGTAQSPNDILVVTVNGLNAGTINWSATLTLSNGANKIAIVAVDKAGNIKTEYKTVTLAPVKTPGFDMLSIIESIMVIYIFKRVKTKY